MSKPVKGTRCSRGQCRAYAKAIRPDGAYCWTHDPVARKRKAEFDAARKKRALATVEGRARNEALAMLDILRLIVDYQDRGGYAPYSDKARTIIKRIDAEDGDGT